MSGEVVDNAEEHYVAQSVCSDDKAQPFEAGLVDSYGADGVDVSSHPSSTSSGGGGETTDVAGSPLLQNTTTDDEVEHCTASLVATPLLAARHQHPVKLSSSAPDGYRQGLLSEKPVAQADKMRARREAENGTRTPQSSPSLYPVTTTTAVVPAGLTMPPSVPALPPRTPSPELQKYSTSAKVTASPPTLQVDSPPPRDLAVPTAALETPSPQAPLLPAPLTTVDCAAPAAAATPPPLRTSPREHSAPASSPRAKSAAVLEEEPDVCCICLEEYSVDNPMFRGECMHHFHLACLMEWKQRSNCCPICCAETLHGVDDMPTPQSRRRADPAEVARQREIAAQDEAYAHKLQRKYLMRAQQQQQQQHQQPQSQQPQSQQPQQQRTAVPTMRMSLTLTASRSPQRRSQLHTTPLPPLASAPRSISSHGACGTLAMRAHSGDSAATTTVASPTSASGTNLSKKHKSRKVNRTTPTQPSPSGSRPRSSSPAVHPHFQGGRRGRRSGQDGCTMM